MKLELVQLWDHLRMHKHVFVGASQVLKSMGVGAFLTEFALALLVKVLARLGFVIVVWYIKHPHCYLNW